MQRFAMLVLLAGALLGGGAGCCRVCQHPFDYCGPLDEGCCLPCWQRYGSILGGPGPVEGEVIYDGAVPEGAVYEGAVYEGESILDGETYYESP